MNNELEQLSCCPICGSESNVLFANDLQDVTFRAVKGVWSFYLCTQCESGFVNPRLNENSISKAYSNYYTHHDLEQDGLSFLGKIKKKLGDGYRNKVFGSSLAEAWPVGYYIISLFSMHKNTMDAGFRHLSKYQKGNLLDVGCGNGDFLSLAKSAGWNVLGLDFDPDAVEISRKKGLNVKIGSVETLENKERFDVITSNHVIEHVHDPVEFLEKCFELLNSDGYLWIDTPNIKSQGFNIYGNNWRGLEIPRHLSIFNEKSLCDLLKKVGFKKIEIMPYRPLCKWMFNASETIKNNSSMDEVNGMNFYVNKKMINKCEKIASLHSEVRETITLKAWKN